MARYRFTNEAVKDLEEIWSYTKQKWSLEQADRYFHLLMDEIEYLTINPKSGMDYSHVRKGYFRSKVKSHFIFYKINLKVNELEIIRILHQQMDIESRLSD